MIIKLEVNQTTHIHPNTVHYHLKVPPKLHKYFTKSTFYISYSCKISKTDAALLMIPGIGLILPLALATGSHIEVDVVDATFLKSIETLKRIVKSMYPHLPSSTNILYKDTKKVVINGNNSAVFFSGGVDSTALLLRHVNEKPFLITVWGSDIPLWDIRKWRMIQSYVKYVCNNVGCNGVSVALDSPINIEMLEQDFMSRLKGNDWWGGIQAGITLPLLAAPVAQAKKIRHVYIASGIPKDLPYSWSDRPEVYNSLSFADVKIICDDYKMSRMDKIREIKERNFWGLKLRVCNIARGRFNCGYCEKCARTIAELCIANLNPREFGFDVDLSTFSTHILKIARMLHSPIEVYLWSEIIEGAKKAKSYVANDKRRIVETLATITFSHIDYFPQMTYRLHIRRKMRLYYNLPLALREYAKNTLIYLNSTRLGQIARHIANMILTR